MIVLIRHAFCLAVFAWAAALPVAAHLRLPGDAGPAARALASLAYAAGAAICHQRPERSMALSGIPLAVCARCTGIYEGAAVAAVILLAIPASLRPTPPGRHDPRTVRALALASLLPSGVTLVYEWTTGDMPSHAVRAAAGAALGVFVAWVVLHLTRRDTQSG